MSPLYSPSALNKVWPRVVAIECFSKEKKKKDDDGHFCHSLLSNYCVPSTVLKRFNTLSMNLHLGFC